MPCTYLTGHWAAGLHVFAAISLVHVYRPSEPFKHPSRLETGGEQDAQDSEPRYPLPGELQMPDLAG